MDDVSKWELVPSFKETLERDGFDYVGCYEIKDNCYKIRLNREAENRRFTIYSFVSFADGGKHIRIGKTEKNGLKSRLTPNNVNKSLHLSTEMSWIKERMTRWDYTPPDATPEMLCEFGQFAGGTPPWEREVWIKYTVPYGGRGLIFARASGTDDREALEAEEKKLINLYNPPCNNDRYLRSARQRKAEWVAKHQREPIRIKGA